MGFSLDGIPLVGAMPGKDRVGFAVGFTGHGLAMGAGSAERAVDRLLNGVCAGRGGRRSIKMNGSIVRICWADRAK